MVKEWTVEESKNIVKNCKIAEGEIYINKKNGNEYKFQGADTLRNLRTHGSIRRL